MTDRDTILDKIAKLLALSVGKGATVHEAAAAAAAAAGLMEKHRIEQAEVDQLRDGQNGNSLRDADPLDVIGKPVLWKLTLGAELAKLNYCRLVALSVMGHGKARLILIGHRQDVAVVRQLYTYLRREIERLARAAVAAQRRVRAGWSRVEATQWGTSFRIGAVLEIVLRLRRAKEQQQRAVVGRNERALVRLENYEQRVVRYCRTLATGPGYGEPPEGFRQNLSGHLAGRVAGRSLALAPPLEAAATKKS
ncbi:MAG: DUF2786 domain-containing protein [Deltaproteobacteria bacterium]|nr:DUF2786 domain-containing protein [Deltaproteobacteria bacterium]